MLVLTRFQGQSIRIGEDVVIHVIEIKDDRVALGFEAPESVEIWREEIPADDSGGSDQC